MTLHYYGSTSPEEEIAADQDSNQIRCFRRLRDDGGRGGIWVMTKPDDPDSERGIFIHGDRTEIVPPKWSCHDLDSMGDVEEITIEEALKEVSDWEDAVDSIHFLLKKYKIPIYTLEAERQAFLDAIIAEPEDDALRLIYADWIDERGESERAELIRVQCELAEICQNNREHNDKQDIEHLCIRESSFLRVLHAEMLRYGVSGLNPKCNCLIRRGFFEAFTLPWEDWNAHADEITRQHPIEEVRLLTMPVLAEDYAVPGVSPQKYWLEGRRTIDIDTWIARTRREALIQLLKLNWPRIKFILPVLPEPPMQYPQEQFEGFF